MRLKHKNVFIFDCDGTILDSFPSSQKILEILAKKFKVSLPDRNTQEFKIMWGRGGYNMIKRYFPNHNPEEVHREWKKLENSIQIDLIEGTEEAIRKLKELGFIVGLVTNRSWKSLKRYPDVVKKLNFDFIQTSEYKKLHRIIRALNPFKSRKHWGTKYFKPEPRVFDVLIKKLNKRNITPEKIICIDDSLVGFEAVFWMLKYQIEFTGVLTGPIKSKKEWYKIVKTEAMINKKFPVISSVAELSVWADKIKEERDFKFKINFFKD